MIKTVDSLSIRIRVGSDPKNTFENVIELKIIVFTRKMRFYMNRY
jgi:hypothetical protein